VDAAQRSAALTHELLASAGIAGHGFGTRTSRLPARLLRPTQVHGSRVAVARDATCLEPLEADAVISRIPGVSVAVVTADCVPVLACSRDGRAVAAIHAGWRGLAQGVVRAGLDALAELATQPLRAVIGPHVGLCCYEVDAPVVSALSSRFPEAVGRALRFSRPGHHMLELAALVRCEIESAGVASEDVGAVGGCTSCRPEIFHSFRRDGVVAGRLTHFIAAAAGA